MKPAEARRCRQRLGLTLVELGARLGVHHMTIWRWEAGKVRIPPPCAQLLELLVASIPKAESKQQTLHHDRGK